MELAEDAALEHGCIAAFTTVRDFEACHAALLWRDSTPTKEPAADVAAADDGHESDDGGLSAEYLQERPALAAAAFALGDQLQLAEEVPADALLLLDLVMAAGTEHVPALGSLMVAGALRVRSASACLCLLSVHGMWQQQWGVGKKGRRRGRWSCAVVLAGGGGRGGAEGGGGGGVVRMGFY